MYLYSFEKLEVWQDARLFVKKIYLLTKQFPVEERFGLSAQIQRATVSVMSNIAEGVSRSTVKEKCRFIEISFGSLMEVLSQLYIAFDLEYISGQQFADTKADIDKIANKLNALNRSFQSR
ncbi:four helix bundle protein [Paludibacter sp.]|uniref:four helix bundle protein n=1 Tax=Paludibacter sp. TaxID=1898105 RepID=UPI0025DD1215|nr:four helix bundle protein [Paludibacter sp.]